MSLEGYTSRDSLPPEQVAAVHPRGYRCLALVGAGGFGTVFRAVQESTGQIVALKMLRRDADVDLQRHQRHMARFERETQLCAQLHHPHIVQLLDKGQTAEGQLFAVFEFVSGITLRDLLTSRGALPAAEAGELMGQVLDALACAHARGVVHRDLKPHNIMVATPGTRPHAKVLDFGIGAFLPHAQAVEYTTLTMTHEVIGTPSYTAPEQLRGESPTVKSDLYAWGLVFLECLTGSTVMHGQTLAEIYHKQLSSEEVPLPPALAGHPLAAILRRTLRKDPRHRAEQASQVHHDLRQLNLASLVGTLQPRASEAASAGTALTATLQHDGFGQAFQSERRQLTVLCCNVGLQLDGGVEPDQEALEALEAQQRDLISLVADVALQYGGYVAGELGGSVMLYFGYPHISDDNARRAAKTALEIVQRAPHYQVHEASAPRIGLEIRMGLHTGMVLTRPDSAPAGLTPNTALQIERVAPAGVVLVSETTRQLLEPHMVCTPWDTGYTGNGALPLKVYVLRRAPQADSLAARRFGQAERPLVGRQAECHTILQHWARTTQGQGGGVLCTGEPGIGKSRLAYEVRMLVQQAGFRTLECRCVPEHHNNALYPILDMLQRQLQVSDAPSPALALARLQSALKQCAWRLDISMPLLCTWLGLPTPPTYAPLQQSPKQQKQILLDIVEQLLVNVGQGKPLLLLVEDVQWLDPTGREFLQRLIDLANRSALLVLLTARPDTPTSWLPSTVHTLTLPRLDRAQIITMVQHLLGGHQMEDATLARVVARADGIPLFIEELVRMLQDRQALQHRQGAYALAADFDMASIPITLRDVLNARLAALGPARETAQMAAAMGRDFDLSLLLKASVRDAAMVQQDLAQMLAADVVSRQPQPQGERYLFRHALLRDAAYDSLPSALQEQAHARIAATLEQHFPDLVRAHPALLASHCAGARHFSTAVTYGTRAAQASLQRALNEETLAHLDQTLAWVQRLAPEVQAEAELQINRLCTQALMGKYGWADPRVKARVDRSRALLSQMPGSPHTVPTLWSLATYHHVAGNRAAARLVSDELCALAEASDDRGLQVAATAMLGVRYRCDGPLERAATYLERALQLYDPEQHRQHGTVFGLDTRVWAAGTLAIVRWLCGASAAALRHDAEALAWAQTINHIPSLGMAMLQHTLLQHHRDDRSAVQQDAGALLRLAEHYDLPAYTAYARVLYCWATDNCAQALDVLNTLHALGCRLALPFYASLPADIEMRRGDVPAAMQRLSDCMVLCRAYDQLNYEPELYRRRAMYGLIAQPTGTATILEDLCTAAALARPMDLRRTEAHALALLIRLGGATSSQPAERLRALRTAYPDLVPLSPSADV